MNGKARPLRDAAMTTRRRTASRTTIWISLIILIAIHETRSEYLMGGHLDNKEVQPRPSIITRRSNEEANNPSTIISSRKSTNFDSDFDLGLDFPTDQSSSDPTRSSVSFTEDEETLEGEESGISPRYRVPLAPYAFNGGQPFSLEKDPITGQIDFEKAPPLKALDYSTKSDEESFLADSPISEDDNSSSTTDANSSDLKSHENLGPNEINPYSPSFHDFLNLPSRYSYDKYDNSEKYPLISSSYANTKVQSGGNSYNTYNHKKYHEAVKGSVDVASHYVQPMRKTYQPVTRSTTTKTPPTTQSTTTEPTTTTQATTTTKFTTTTAPPTIRTTTKRLPSRYAPVTTWKPQRPRLPVKYPSEATDYEGTLPIERLQTSSTTKAPTTTESSIYVHPEKMNEEYDDGYEDYDHLFGTAVKPSSESDHKTDSNDDYNYGVLDLIGETNSQSTTSKSTMSTTVNPEKNIISSSDPPTTYRPTSSSTMNDRRTTFSSKKEDVPASTTTVRSTSTEEKRVTSMPLDTIDENYRPYGSNAHQGGIDNSIPSVTSNVVYQQLRPPSNDHQYYSRPSPPLTAPGIVVQSTSNVVVPPGQDTVSFVLGNRQSVGSVSDAGNEYYSVHTGSINERPSINFGKIGNSRPMIPDNYPGEMIVSAGIGVGQNSVGQSYNQRPSTNVAAYDHSVVSVGMPTVEIANTGDSESISNINKNKDSSTNTLDSLAQKWWASTSSSSTKKPQIVQETSNPQDYRVVFPDDGPKKSNDNSAVTQRPIEEHVIVIHESDIGPGNKLGLEIPSQSVSTSNPSTSFFYETTTLRSVGSNEDQQRLPELSESLTPPAERPNRVPITSHRPPSYYNYYHHQSHNPGNSRPNDYRDQRPQRVPLQPPPQTSSSSNGFKRRPPSTSLENNLPNILPQFRPNAKTSHGHNRGETIGTIPAGAIGHYPSTWFRRPPTSHHHHNPHQHHSSPSRPRPSSPSHLQRLNPPPLPPLSPPINSLRLPTPAALVAPPELGITNKDSQAQNSDEVSRLAIQKRLHKVVVGVPPSLNIDERHQSGQIKSRLEDDNVEKFSAEPPDHPPRAPFFSKRNTAVGNSGDSLPEGMPRVATLQMIQQHGGRDDDALRPNLPPPYRYNSENSDRHDDREKDDDNSGRPSVNRRGDEATTVEIQGDEGTRSDYGEPADSPVYVVYPVKGALDIRPPSHAGESDLDDDGSVVLGTYGSQRPLPPDTLLKDTSDDSSNGEQHYRPSSINVSPSFTDSSSPQLASDFPYPLERPDPSMFTSQLSEKPLLVPSDHSKDQQTDLQEEEEDDDEEEKNIDRGDDANEEVKNQHDFERDASANVIPYIQDHLPFALRDNNAAGPISATLHRLGGSSVVAASSTPIAYVYTPTMRTPVRRTEEIYHHAGFERPVLLPSQQASSSSSSAPAPQSFMAPFVASASAEAPTKNGWSVVMVGSPANGSSMDRRRGDSNIRGDGEKELDKGDKDNEDDEKKKNDKDDDGEEDKKMKGEEKKSTETDEQETQTEKSEFDVENFTPQLFGGFKPIFEFPSDTDTVGDKVSGDVMVERPRSNSENDGVGREIRVSDV